MKPDEHNVSTVQSSKGKCEWTGKRNGEWDRGQDNHYYVQCNLFFPFSGTCSSVKGCHEHILMPFVDESHRFYTPCPTICYLPGL